MHVMINPSVVFHLFCVFIDDGVRICVAGTWWEVRGGDIVEGLNWRWRPSVYISRR